MRKAKDIIAYFKDWNIGEESRSWMYLEYHCRRYEFLLAKIDETVIKIQGTLKILDIGPSFETEILRKTFPEAIVNTLGFEDSRFKPRPQDKHIQFDLNDIQYPERWPKIERHNLVIMAEVIEHLYTSPKLVLQCIATWLDKKGYLIIQTPNAVSLGKRLKMLMGKHPYGMIRETRSNPGHFREYTIGELISISRGVGFVLSDYAICNYFRREGVKGIIYNVLCSVFPITFRDGITICFRKIWSAI